MKEPRNEIEKGRGDEAKKDGWGVQRNYNFPGFQFRLKKHGRNQNPVFIRKKNKVLALINIEQRFEQIT
jgi:hypothetical protein